MVSWSWDRRSKLCGRVLEGCLGALHWSPPDTLRGTLMTMERKAALAPKAARRAVLLRVGRLELAFPRLDVATKALRDLYAVCSHGGYNDGQEISDSSTCNEFDPELYMSSKHSKRHAFREDTQCKWRGETEGEVACGICLEDMMVGEAQWQLPCSHAFHATCMHRWLHSGGTCPVCRCRLAGKTLRHCSC